MKSLLVIVSLSIVFATTIVEQSHSNPSQEVKSPSQDSLSALGQKLFFDTSLSSPEGQACVSCHQPAFAYADKGKVISAGANPTLFALSLIHI